MRKVIVFEYVLEVIDGRQISVPKQKCLATFHQFGVWHEEFETGAGNYSTAIVEFADGTVDSVPVHMIQFVTPTELGAIHA